MSQSTVDYDRIAEVYDLWVKSRQRELLRISEYYLRYFLETEGVAVELGVGDGRLLVSAARQGTHCIGVDSSKEMIALAARHASEAGVIDRIRFVRADFREFALPQAASIIAMPYDSIGHLIQPEDKRRCIKQVFGQLAPGGRFIFDYEVFDRASIERVERRMFLHYVDEERSAEPRMIWLTSTVDWENRSKRVHMWLDTVAADGAVSRRWVGAVGNSWISDAGEVRDMLTGAGFAVERCLGDFDDGAALDEKSKTHVWIARKPASST